MADDLERGVGKLTADNWLLWSVRLESLLQIKDCWTAVEGSDLRRDSKALAYIRLNVGDQFLPTVRAAETSKAAWEALERLFEQKSTARKLQLRMELAMFALRPGERLEAYFARAEDLRLQLTAAGSQPSEEDIVLAALGGLPDEFNVIATVLEQSEMTLTLDLVRARLLLAEQKLSRTSAAPAGTEKALVSFQQPSHHQQRPQQQNQQPRSPHATKRCFKCHQLGHIARNCRSKQKQPAKAYGAEDAVALASVAGNDTLLQQTQWILDSGASRHITGSSTGLSNVRTVSDQQCRVLFANGQHELLTAVGDAAVTSKGVHKAMSLTDLLVAPGAAANLLSIPAAMARGATFEFRQNRVDIFHNGVKLATAVQRDDGIYVIGGTQHANSTSSVAAAASTQPAVQLWHRRLGHLGATSLSKMVQHNMVEGLNMPLEQAKAFKDEVCEHCLQAKQTRTPFLQSKSTCERPMQLVHMDLMGPLPVLSLGRKRYLATFLDDYSKLSVVRPVASKAEVPGVVKEVLEMLQTQSGQKLQAVRTDNGTEYVNEELRSYFRDRGVVHQTTVPANPEQNGKAERLNRTILEKVRAMLHEAKLGKELWAEAANTANYLRNRSPTADGTKTPWELFFGKKPTVSNLRVFGSVAHVHVAKHQRDKLDARSFKGIMVGYAAHSKGWRILFPDGSIKLSRDVVFEEHSASAADPSSLQQLSLDWTDDEDEAQEDQQKAIEDRGVKHC